DEATDSSNDSGVGVKVYSKGADRINGTNGKCFEKIVNQIEIKLTLETKLLEF
ncbi:11702_t:CDS:2, partial [Gigaspora margarita]